MQFFKVSFSSCSLLLSLLALGEVNYNREVRPILSENCFACHGLDKKHRKADLRLDIREDAIADRDGTRAIVPGDLSQSEFWARIISEDEDELMPPPKSHKKLTIADKEVLSRWIKQGAKYEGHWSFVSARDQSVPQIAGTVSPIDAFLQDRLRKEGLKPAKTAKPETLARRVYLDLTGLPPTPAEVEAFLGDQSSQAWSKLIDGLMARETYGEHMARYWLDLARYADTHGLHLDNERSMWPYRDWVVRAFNENLPFDEFTRWQLAGDLLAEPTVDQRIASGFNRCNVTTGEGGSIKEEWIYRYAVDRTSTAVEVWMGLTAGCAVCHDHKFDPLSTKEYYSLYAFFHSAADPAMDGNKKDTPPILRVPHPGDKEKLAVLEKQIKSVEKRISEIAAKVAYVDPAELDAPPKPILKETVWIEDGFPAKAVRQANKEWKTVTKPEPVFSGDNAFVLDAKGLEQLVIGGANPPLVVEKGMKLFAHVYLDTINPPKQIMLQFHSGNWNQRAYWGESKITWGKEGAASRRRMGKLPEAGKWVRLEVDAEQVGFKPGDNINGWAYTHFDGKAYWDKSGAVVISNPSTDPTLSWVVWKAQPENARKKDLPHSIWGRLLGKAPEKWTDAEQSEVFRLWIESVYAKAPKALVDLKAQKAKLARELDAISKNTAITFVMADLPNPRESFVMIRGQYDNPGEKVSRGTPAFLPALPPKPKDRDYNRLDLANWLVSPHHPLTARVAVNRIWQQFFGTGLVATSADFGTQGELPSHPELLDWLALRFIEDDWNVQRFIKRILTSHAYRQSSIISPALLERDPQNRLLARGSRYRLDAEMIRDQALHLSGLLVPALGGRGVMPYQPPNIWEPVGFGRSNTRYYKQGKGEDLYRRSLYTFLKRTAPAPFMASFDAPNREQTCTARGRSNTPMQALQLMNDVQHVEAARNLAQRIIKEGGAKNEARIEWAWRTVTSRRPEASETQVVVDLLRLHEARFSDDLESAQKLIAYGESSPDKTILPRELAAWTLVANLFLNLDEVVNKN